MSSNGHLTRVKELYRTARERPAASESGDFGFPPGKVLAERYSIVELLGRGATGEVYLAEDLVLGQPVALKLLPKAAKDDPRRLEPLLEEVRVARRITHPNVCRVYDVGLAGGYRFLSMEYVEGEDLAALLKRRRLARDEALDIARQIARGLAAAHRQGVAHRDLKPANLMIDRGGRAVITDFGLARLAETVRGVEVSFGTPAYMAPEQRKGREVTIKSDLYALGMVLYELFTGRYAFEDATAAEPIRTEAAGMPVPPSAFAPGLDPAVERVVLRCLAPDPRDRPISAEAVAVALPGGDPLADGGVLKTVVACELLVEGDRGAELELRHDRLARDLLEENAGRMVEGSELRVFERPFNAVSYALAYHGAVARLEQEGQPAEGRERDRKIAGRAAVHFGEVAAQEDGTTVPLDAFFSLTALRLLALAAPRQTLLSRGAFDVARQTALGAGDRSTLDRLSWLAHGSYELDGMPEPLEVFEVGVSGTAPLAAPGESAGARRVHGRETILGWRPARGLPVPHRPGYRVERKVGQGGFGEVWLATHGESGERRVFKFCYEDKNLRALQREITLFRLLKEELGDREDITRILGWQLEDPPYFIESEHTPGGSLLDWAEERGGIARVPLEERLDILAQAAEALAAAHSIGVLHKDVKPANVLITHDGEGRPRARLTDFGLGIVTDRGRLEEAGITVLGMTAETAATASAGGTRLYMAPELLEGKPATVQADVYALGVMLYQLVVGDLRRALAPGWERHVEDEVLVEDVAAAVDGSPERRLPSALELARRLRSLKARRISRRVERRERVARERQRREAERAKKDLARARRRRWLFAAVAAVAALYAGTTALQNRRIAEEAERANQVADFLADLFEDSDPRKEQGAAATAREILDRGAERIHRLHEQPRTRARLLATMGIAYRNLGEYEKARELAQEALELRRELFGSEHPRVAESLDELGVLARRLGEYEKAKLLLDQALRMRRRLLPSDHPDLAVSLNNLAVLLKGQGDYRAAEARYREALEIQRRQGAEETGDLAVNLYNLARLLTIQGDLEGAEPLFRESLELRQRLFGDEHPAVATGLKELATLLMAKGDHAAAEPLLQKALSVNRRLLGEAHSDTIDVLANLARLLRERGDLEAAEPLYRQALEAERRARGEQDHPQVAIRVHNLARLLEAKGDSAGAEPLYRQALTMGRKVWARDHPHLAAFESNLAGLLVARGEAAAAELLIRNALTTLRQAYSPGHWRIKNAESVLGVCLARLDTSAEAEPLLLGSYLALKEQKGEDDEYTQKAVARLVDFYEARDEPGKAAEYRLLLRTP